MAQKPRQWRKQISNLVFISLSSFPAEISRSGKRRRSSQEVRSPPEAFPKFLTRRPFQWRQVDDMGGQSGSWTPTKRRGPIAAEFQGPGPAALALPSLFGSKDPFSYIVLANWQLLQLSGRAPALKSRSYRFESCLVLVPRTRIFLSS